MPGEYGTAHFLLTQESNRPQVTEEVRALSVLVLFADHARVKAGFEPVLLGVRGV